MGRYRLAAIIPCYGRYERTKRIARQIAQQKNCNKEEFVALFVGDGCKDFEFLMEENFFAELNDTSNVEIQAVNLKKHFGGYGYVARNLAKELVDSQYFIFIDNDDEILLNHFDNYLSAIEGTDYEMMYFNSVVEPYAGLRYTRLEQDRIGHAEIIVRGDVYKAIPNQTDKYGHDWEMIKSIIDRGGAISFAFNHIPTYIVKGIPNKREVGID